MKPILHPLLAAYQPLRQRGLLLDGRPSFGRVPSAAAEPRRRATLVALTGLLHLLFRPGDPS
jgi:hypothetical protein